MSSTVAYFKIPVRTDDDSGSEDSGATPNYRSMSARELRSLARDRGLTGHFNEGRGNRRTALIEFLESGSLDRLPGCDFRGER